MALSSADEESSYGNTSSDDDDEKLDSARFIPTSRKLSPSRVAPRGTSLQKDVIDSDEATSVQMEVLDSDEATGKEEDRGAAHRGKANGIEKGDSVRRSLKRKIAQEREDGSLEDQRIELTRRLGKVLQKLIESGPHILYATQLEEAFTMHVERERLARSQRDATVASQQDHSEGPGRRSEGTRSAASSVVTVGLPTLYSDLSSILLDRLRHGPRKKLRRLLQEAIKSQAWEVVARKYSRKRQAKEGREAGRESSMGKPEGKEGVRGVLGNDRVPQREKGRRDGDGRNGGREGGGAKSSSSAAGKKRSRAVGDMPGEKVGGGNGGEAEGREDARRRAAGTVKRRKEQLKAPGKGGKEVGKEGGTRVAKGKSALDSRAESIMPLGGSHRAPGKPVEGKRTTVPGPSDLEKGRGGMPSSVGSGEGGEGRRQVLPKAPPESRGRHPSALPLPPPPPPPPPPPQPSPRGAHRGQGASLPRPALLTGVRKPHGNVKMHSRRTNRRRGSVGTSSWSCGGRWSGVSTRTYNAHSPSTIRWKASGV
ncbi:hypothetical protein Naga_100009g1, partial [Nannochloropsis gaditana]